MKVYYLGPEGSYSHQLAEKAYPSDQLIALSSFEEIVNKAETEDEAVGLLVIENSTSSSVHRTVDLMFESSAKITGEAYMPITLDLLAKPETELAAIDIVYSHTQALSQCSKYLDEHNFETEIAKSTASAAGLVSKSEQHVAAIGHSFLASRYGLKAIDHNIGNVSHNISRWIMVQKDLQVSEESVNKLTVLFTLKHEPGSLVNVLSRIAQINGNLSKIESRPQPGTNWEYEFWVDIEIPKGSVSQFKQVLGDATSGFDIIGMYRRGRLFEKDSYIMHK